MQQTTIFDYYQTNLGIFFKLQRSVAYSSYYIGAGIRFDDCLITNLQEFPGGFRQYLSIPSKVYKLQPAKSELKGFTLIDKSLSSDKIPEYLSFDEVNQYYDDDTESLLWTNYNNIRILYKEVRVSLPEEFVEIQAEFKLISEIFIENYNHPEKLIIKSLDNNQYSPKPVDMDLSKIASISELDALLTPEFLHHIRPCSLTSQQTYKIVRQYVKEHIDLTQAQITSDYDFCFNVRKKIKLAEPEHGKSEVYTPSGKSYKPPKYKNYTETTTSVDIFEMTNSSDKYKGYTVIDGFKGDSLQDLYNNINGYLSELISVINSKMAQCSSCKGTGHHIEYAKVHKE